MASSDEKKELSGLARSIDALFESGSKEGPEGEPHSDAAPPPEGGSPAQEAGGDTLQTGGGEDIVWEEVAEEEAPPRKTVTASPKALREAVTAFMKADPLARDGMGRAIRDQAAALRETNALDALADAVERLALESGDPPDDACIAMAQSLLTPGVASRIVAYLGSSKHEERRAELVTVCQRLGHDMGLAIADALSGTQDRAARRAFLDAMVALGETAMPIIQKMVDDSRWFVVRNALAILGDIGGERSVELIVSSLAHPEPKVRREALLSLAKVGGEDAGMLVYGMLDDTDSDVRLAAAMAAGALKVQRALRPLLAQLDGESDPDVQAAVLRALGQLGDPGAVNAIEKRAVTSFFSRPPTDVRIAAYRALHGIGTPHAKSLLVQAADDKDPAVRGAVRQLLGMR